MREPAPFGKVMGAFLVASIAASLVGGVMIAFQLSQNLSAGFSAIPFTVMIALTLGFPIAFGHALVLGLPAYLWLERRGAVRWWGAMLAGGVIGVLPLLLWAGPAAAVSESIDLLLVPGVSGAVGGLVFRAALSDLMRNP